MPTEIVVSLAAMLFVPIATSLGYVFVWPGFEGRRGILLVVAIPIAIAVGVAAIWWHLQIFQGVGISGEAVPGSEPWSSFEKSLRIRFWIAMLCAALMEALVCYGITLVLKDQ